MLLQENVVNNKLEIRETSKIDEDFAADLLFNIEANNWEAIRTKIAAMSSVIQWEGLYKTLYDSISVCTKFHDRNKWASAIVIIANRLYYNSTVADPEINFIACIIELGKL